jgi:hypothetical protein
VRTRAPSVTKPAAVEAGQSAGSRSGAGPLLFRRPDGTEYLAWKVRVPSVVEIEPGIEAQLGGEGSGNFGNGNAIDAMAVGDVVVIVGTTVEHTTTPQDTRPVGVCLTGGNAGDQVLVQVSGVCPLVNVTAPVTAENYAETSGTAGLATENATPRAGSFGQYLTPGTTPSILLFGQTYLSGGGGGGGSSSYPWRSVTDYGAVGDGTTDDTAAIQAAIDACAAYETLYFPLGAYKITSSLVVAANIRLLGTGGYLAAGATPSASAIVMHTNNTTAISQTNHPGMLTIEGIHIVNAASASSGGNGIHALGSIILTHVYIDGFYDGIYVDGLTGDPYNVFINKTDVHACTRIGLYLDGKVNNFHLDGFNAFSNQQGIYISGGVYGGSIAHGDFEGNTSTGITIDGFASSQTTDSILISQCYFEQDTGSPTANISLGPATLVQGVVIEQCIFVLGPSSLVHLRANHVDRLTLIGDHFWHGSDSGSILCDATNTTNVTLVNVKADGSVTTPATTRIIDATDVTPADLAGAAAVGTSKYFARADHAHAGITVKDEGGALATAATSLDFVGAGVVASGTGAAKTITIAGGVATLDDLTDVTITTPTLADRLRYNGSAWVNSALLWAPVMVLDPGSGNYLVLTDTSGNPIMAEV